jgi:hypothetical protein
MPVVMLLVLCASAPPKNSTIKPTPDKLVVDTPPPLPFPEDIEIFELPEGEYTPLMGPGYFYPPYAHAVVWEQIYYAQEEYPRLAHEAIRDTALNGHRAITRYAHDAELNTQVREARASQSGFSGVVVIGAAVLGTAIGVLVYGLAVSKPAQVTGP